MFAVCNHEATTLKGDNLWVTELEFKSRNEVIFLRKLIRWKSIFLVWNTHYICHAVSGISTHDNAKQLAIRANVSTVFMRGVQGEFNKGREIVRQLYSCTIATVALFSR